MENKSIITEKELKDLNATIKHVNNMYNKSDGSFPLHFIYKNATVNIDVYVEKDNIDIKIERHNEKKHI